MKTLIIILTIVISSIFQQTSNEKDLIGSWFVTKSYNETKRPCDANSSRIKDFKLTFVSADKYEMTTNYGTIMKINGKYSLDNKNKILKLTYNIEKQSFTLKVPVISQTQDFLIIKYNLCGSSDTTSIVSGRLELKKAK